MRFPAARPITQRVELVPPIQTAAQQAIMIRLGAGTKHAANWSVHATRSAATWSGIRTARTTDLGILAAARRTCALVRASAVMRPAEAAAQRIRLRDVPMRHAAHQYVHAIRSAAIRNGTRAAPATDLFRGVARRTCALAYAGRNAARAPLVLLMGLNAHKTSAWRELASIYRCPLEPLAGLATSVFMTDAMVQARAFQMMINYAVPAAAVHLNARTMCLKKNARRGFMLVRLALT